MTATLPTWRAGGGYKYIARLEHLYNLLTKCKKYILNSLGAKHKDVMLHAKMWQWRFINKYNEAAWQICTDAAKYGVKKMAAIVRSK